MIPQEAIEAAANAISECSGMRFDGFWSRVEDLEPEDREYALMEAKAAVEAAAPFLRAQALEEAADEGWAHILDLARRKQMVPGADDFRDWLRARAATERGL